MSAKKTGGKGKPDEFEDIWFSDKGKNQHQEERMPNFQFYDDNRRTFLVIGSMVAIFLFAGILWFLYYQQNIAPPGEVDTIVADSTPVKVRPVEPGGLEVPDQDKLIYDRVSGEETALEERVQPATEQPMDDIPDQSIEDIIRETEPEPTQVAEAVPATPTPQPASDIAPGAFIIQLGAFGERAGAERAWNIWSDRYKTVIGSLTPDIQETTRDDGSTLYRLRAGFFSDRDRATDICQRLKALGLEACLVGQR